MIEIVHHEQFSVIKPGINYDDIIVIEWPSGNGSQVVTLYAGIDEKGGVSDVLSVNRENTRRLFDLAEANDPHGLEDFMRTLS